MKSQCRFDFSCCEAADRERMSSYDALTYEMAEGNTAYILRSLARVDDLVVEAKSAELRSPDGLRLGLDEESIL